MLLELINYFRQRAWKIAGYGAFEAPPHIRWLFVEPRLPAFTGRGVCPPRHAPGIQNIRRHVEGSGGPSERRLGLFDLISAQRRAMRGRGPLFVRCAKSNDGLTGDEGRHIGEFGLRDRLINRVHIVAINAQCGPAGRFKAG